MHGETASAANDDALFHRQVLEAWRRLCGSQQRYDRGISKRLAQPWLVDVGGSSEGKSVGGFVAEQGCRVPWRTSGLVDSINAIGCSLVPAMPKKLPAGSIAVAVGDR